jgi:hypothetical protein
MPGALTVTISLKPTLPLLFTETRILHSSTGKPVVFCSEKVNFHQLKPVALLYYGFACPPAAAISIHQSYWWY